MDLLAGTDAVEEKMVVLGRHLYIYLREQDIIAADSRFENGARSILYVVYIWISFLSH